MKPTNVVVVEPNQLFREGLRQILCRPPFAVVAAVGDAGEITQGFNEVVPDLVVWSSCSGGDVEAQMAWLRKQYSGPQRVRFVLLADGADVAWIRRVAVSGADAVLSQSISSEVLHRSLDLVMLGQQLFPAVLVHALAESAAAPQAELIPFPTSTGARATVLKLEQQRSVVLSEREKQILRCLVNGATNKAIARELFITETTVKAHVKGLLRKIRARNRTQAAIWAFNNTTRALEPVDQGAHRSLAGMPDRRTAS